MKVTALLLAVLLTASGCTSIGKHRDEATRNLRLRASHTSDQIDNINYVIYQHYQRYQAAGGSGGDRNEQRQLEVELGKLREVQDHLESEQIKLGREIGGR